MHRTIKHLLIPKNKTTVNKLFHTVENVGPFFVVRTESFFKRLVAMGIQTK